MGTDLAVKLGNGTHFIAERYYTSSVDGSQRRASREIRTISSHKYMIFIGKIMRIQLSGHRTHRRRFCPLGLDIKPFYITLLNFPIRQVDFLPLNKR